MLIGGHGPDGEIWDFLKNVDEYTTTGWVKALPPLQHARALHGCGVIEQVSFELLFNINSSSTKHCTQTLIVAGGYNTAGGLDSTEVLRPGSSTWQTVSAHPYPGVARGAVIRGGFYLSRGKGIN